jgi:hypothetical protein
VRQVPCYFKGCHRYSVRERFSGVLCLRRRFELADQLSTGAGLEWLQQLAFAIVQLQQHRERS